MVRCWDICPEKYWQTSWCSVKSVLIRNNSWQLLQHLVHPNLLRVVGGSESSKLECNSLL